ncbi:nicotinate-nucleotide adenylyltransferase [Desulfofundulus luciae]|uniref:Probable nicotinate-nucleotide adenylyltransferase n=1 Tax=Desulfofundulus luciae TaxID=74702 RepID=A0ABU0B0R5_9FIRM|nr:nicotinate-nucleotide adenylyltransferase [Desulfofundulus luciae]MDQ0285516.1 nicotinate-nucleotide adenylyltransferase [Desulfofundulus luciae]
MAQTLKRLGIMGGTFDPIHYGHLVAAEGARHAFQLEKVIFIPAGRPPHKTGRKISDPHHRWIMTELAVASNPYFDTSSIEVERPGYSYTIDTVREVRNLYPGAEIFFITGADAVLEILNWKNVNELLEMCWFIAATRPGYPLGNLKRRLAGIDPEHVKRIIPMEVPALAISSTEIRARVQEGRPIKYLLPEPVEAYILNRGLYKS